MFKDDDVLVTRAMDAEHQFEFDVRGPARAGRERDRGCEAASLRSGGFERQVPRAHDVRCREQRDVGFGEQGDQSLSLGRSTAIPRGIPGGHHDGSMLGDAEGGAGDPEIAFE